MKSYMAYLIHLIESPYASVYSWKRVTFPDGFSRKRPVLRQSSLRTRTGDHIGLLESLLSIPTHVHIQLGTGYVTFSGGSFSKMVGRTINFIIFGR